MAETTVKEVIQIRTLGDFSISYGGNTISESTRGRSKKIWTLLKYLIAFREREIARKELIDVVFGGKGSKTDENAVGALKTLLHRLRAVLRELGLPEDWDIIVNISGTYGFNTSLPYTVDAAEFENCFKNAFGGVSEKEREMFLRRALELYKGEFLPKTGTKSDNGKSENVLKSAKFPQFPKTPDPGYENWVAPMRAYYGFIFLRSIHEIIDIYVRHKQFTELVNVCNRALLTENLDQKIHVALIRGLNENGAREAAKQHYHYAVGMFYDTEGINPSPELLSLYEEIIKSEESFEPDIEEIKAKLSGEEDSGGGRKGAFYCEYELFKHVYRLEKFDSKRTGRESRLCLLTIRAESGEQLGKAMQLLLDVITASLRKNDVFARYSASQFVILLLNAGEENIGAIMERVLKRFRDSNPESGTDISWSQTQSG